MKKALLAASFGTTYKETCEKTIGAVENELAAAFPHYDVKRAFTSKMIARVLQKRDGIHVDSVCEALENLQQAGYQEVLVQPLHILNGFEYHTVEKAVKGYTDKFSEIRLGMPLLSSPEDYIALVDSVSKTFPEVGEKEAVVLMGHGTSHSSNMAYQALDYAFSLQGFARVYIGLVEGEPELPEIMERLEKDGIRKVTLMPLMLVAGDHAKNDMAGDDEDSWKSMLQEAGYEVDIILQGLGEVADVRKMYVNHAQAAGFLSLNGE